MHNPYFDQKHPSQLFPTNHISIAPKNDYYDDEIQRHISHIINGDIKFRFYDTKTQKSVGNIDSQKDYRILALRRKGTGFSYNRKLTSTLYGNFFSHFEPTGTVNNEDYIAHVKALQNDYQFPALTNPDNHFMETSIIEPDDHKILSYNTLDYEFFRKVYIAKILNNPILCFMVQKSDWYDLEFTKEILYILQRTFPTDYTVNPSSFIPPIVFQQEQIARFIASHCSRFFSYLTEEHRVRYARQAIAHCSNLFTEIPMHARTDELCDLAVQLDLTLLQYCNETILSDKGYLLDFARSNITNGAHPFIHMDFNVLPENLKGDLDFVDEFLSIICMFNELFEHDPEQLEPSYITELHPAAYRHNLSWLSDELKSNTELCSRLASRGYSSFYFSKKLRASKHIGLECTNVKNFQYFSPKLRSDRIFVENFSNKFSSLEETLTIIAKLTPPLCNDIDFIISLIIGKKANRWNFYDFDEEVVGNDDAFSMAQILKNKRLKGTILYSLAPDELENITLNRLRKIALHQKLLTQTTLRIQSEEEQEEEDEPISKI